MKRKSEPPAMNYGEEDGKKSFGKSKSKEKKIKSKEKKNSSNLLNSDELSKK